MIKNRWNTDLEEWIHERFFSKEEVTELIDNLPTVDMDLVEVNITYEDESTEVRNFYVEGRE